MRFRVFMCVCVCVRAQVCMHVVTKAKPKVIVRLVMSEQWTWGRRFTHGQGSNWQMISFRLIVQHKNTNIIAKMYFCVISKRYFQPQRFLAWRGEKKHWFRVSILTGFSSFFDAIQTTLRQVILILWVGGRMSTTRKHIFYFFLIYKVLAQLHFFLHKRSVVLWKFILLSALKCSK